MFFQIILQVTDIFPNLKCEQYFQNMSRDTDAINNSSLKPETDSNIEIIDKTTKSQYIL